MESSNQSVAADAPIEKDNQYCTVRPSHVPWSDIAKSLVLSWAAAKTNQPGRRALVVSMHADGRETEQHRGSINEYVNLRFNEMWACRAGIALLSMQIKWAEWTKKKEEIKRQNKRALGVHAIITNTGGVERAPFFNDIGLPRY